MKNGLSLALTRRRAVSGQGAVPLSAVGSVTDTIASGGGAKSISLASLNLRQNDVVLVAIACDDLITAGNGDIVTSGYTTEYQPSSGTGAGMQVAWKRMGATPDTVLEVNDENDKNTAVIVRAFRGVDETTALDVVPTTASAANSGMPDAPSITTVTAGAYVVAIGALDDDSPSIVGTVTAPAGYSDLSVSEVDDGFSSVHLMMAHKEVTNPGAEDPAAFGGSGFDDWAAVTVVLRPAVPLVVEPSAFVDADWSVTTGDGEYEIDVTIASLPAANGSPITDIEFDVDADENWQSLGATSGTVALTMPADDTSYAIRLRAVNGVGSGEAGNSESANSAATVSYGLLFEYNFDGADADLTYTINGRDITDGGLTNVSTGYSTDPAGYYSTPGALVFRNSGSPNAAETASFDITTAPDGSQIDLRVGMRVNNFGSVTGTIDVRFEFQDDAGTDLGSFIADLNVSAVADILILDEQYSAIKPAGATRLRVIVDPVGSDDIWDNVAVALNYIGAMGVNGSGEWTSPPPPLGGDLGVVSEVNINGEIHYFDAAYQMYQHPDGTTRVPVGAQLVSKTTMPQASPLRNGIMLNPTYSNSADWQAWDSRITDDDLTEQGTLPHTFAANDVLNMAVSRNPDGTGGGVSGTTSSKTTFYSTTIAPDPTSPPPGLVRSRSDVPALPALILRSAVDWASRLAVIPTYTLTTSDRPDINAKIPAYGADIGLNMSRDTSGGYEYYMNYRTGDATSNYGGNQARETENFLMILDNAISASDRELLFKAGACAGSQEIDSAIASGLTLNIDGGHHQWELIRYLLALHARGELNSGAASDWIVGQGFGSYKQAFQITQSMLDNDFQPHTNNYNHASAGPQFMFLREVLGVSGDRITVRGNQENQVSFENLPCVLQNGTTVGTVAFMEGGNKNGMTPWYFDLGSGEGSGVSVGDFVRFDWINGVAPAAGSYHWTESSNIFDFSPSKQTGYVGIQQWIPTYIMAKVLGASRSEFDAFFGYVEQAYTDSALVFPNDGVTATPYLQDWIAQHWSTFTAL